MSLSREAVLAELGIVQWRARPSLTFPGGPQQNRSELALLQLSDPSAKAACDGSVSVIRDISGPQAVDILLHAEAVTAAEAELLARMAEAVRGLRPGLQVATTGLADTSLRGRVSVRLDGVSLPTLAAILADPARKRPVWQALKEAVARLP